MNSSTTISEFIVNNLSNLKKIENFFAYNFRLNLSLMLGFPYLNFQTLL